VVWRASFAPFGQPVGACDTDQDGADDDACPVEQPLRFPGQWDDAGTGLYYNWHRYYVPGLGVYTRLDPLRTQRPSRRALGLRGYALGNPLVVEDPTGLEDMGPEGYAAASDVADVILDGLAALGRAVSGIGCTSNQVTDQVVEEYKQQFFWVPFDECARTRSLSRSQEDCPGNANEQCGALCAAGGYGSEMCERAICHPAQLSSQGEVGDQHWRQIHNPQEIPPQP
jgi:RHS repeat-associated protein